MALSRLWTIGIWAFALPLYIAPTISISLSSGSGLGRRAVQSAATCIDQFNWMDNSLQQSPCMVAAYLLAACAGGNWNVDQVTPNTHYTPPNATNANGCRCSWAVYNTLQACADCQGQNYQSAMLSWAGYNGECPASLLSDTEYYPDDTPIPDETAIPFWAITNPSTWHNGLFDPSIAQSIANEEKSDVTQSSRSSDDSGKKTNSGAIAGGVVGVVIALLALAALFFYRRMRRHRRHHNNNNVTQISRKKSAFSSVRFSPLSHTRSMSDATIGAPGQGYYTSKYRAANGNGQYTLTPSPGPTVPVSMMITGSSGITSGGRPPYNTMPSSSSFSATASPPPGEYVMHTQPGKYNNTTGVGGLTPTGMGMVTMNNPSQPTMSVSSAYATAPSVSAIARNRHAHTLSNGSTVSGMAEEPLEGAIDPYVLPPMLPEPMGSEGATNNVSKGGHGHGRGTSDSSAQLSQEHYTTASTGRKPLPERRNPPAYTPLSPPSPPGIVLPSEDGFGETEGERGDGMSVEAQLAETTLSGTTLRGQGSGASASASAGAGAQADGERDKHRYPVDRKV